MLNARTLVRFVLQLSEAISILLRAIWEKAMFVSSLMNEINSRESFGSGHALTILY